MATATLTSPTNNETGFGTYFSTPSVTCSFLYLVSGSGDPAGSQDYDIGAAELYIDGNYVKTSTGWKGNGTHGISSSFAPLTTYTIKFGLIRYYNGGAQWDRIYTAEHSFTTVGPPVVVQDLQLGSGGNFILAPAEDGVYISSDFGDNWTKKLPDGVAETDWAKGICSSDGTYMIVVSNANSIYRSANGGGAWAAITPAGGDTYSVNKMATSDDGQYMIIVGTNSTDATKSCYISSNYGVTWTAKNPTNISVVWTDCSISNDGSIIAVSASGYFEMSFDSGTTWKGQTVAATTTNWFCTKISGNGSVGLITNLSNNNEFFLGAKTAAYTKETWAESTLTSAGRALLDDTTAAAQATTLGLGTGDAVTHDTLTLSSIAAEGSDVDKFLVDSTGVVKYRTGAQVLSDIGASASAHLHDTQTLEHDAVNSDGGAFSFTTTGLVTFNQSVAAANYAAANLLTAAATNAGELDFTSASKKLDVEGNAVVDQDYSSDASPTFAGLNLSTVASLPGTVVSGKIIRLLADHNLYLGRGII